MKKLLFLAALVCAVALAPPRAHAGSFHDEDQPNANVTSGSPFTSTFNFITDDGDGLNAVGYNPATEVVTAVHFTFQLENIGHTETFSLVVAGSALTDPSVNPLSFTDSWIGGGSLTIPPAVLTAAQSGVLPYTISALGASSFTVDSARMDITTAPKGAPDGGSTLALLGFAVCGLGLVQRKIRS